MWRKSHFLTAQVTFVVAELCQGRCCRLYKQDTSRIAWVSKERRWRTSTHATESAYTVIYSGTRWRSWLRHCATSRKVAGSIPHGITGISHWHNPSGRTMALGVDSASNGNDYQEYFLGGKSGRCRLSTTLGALTSWNPQGLSRPVTGLLHLYIQSTFFPPMKEFAGRMPIQTPYHSGLFSYFVALTVMRQSQNLWSSELRHCVHVCVATRHHCVRRLLQSLCPPLSDRRYFIRTQDRG
jgi:hypothetical protein